VIARFARSVGLVIIESECQAIFQQICLLRLYARFLMPRSLRLHSLPNVLKQKFWRFTAWAQARCLNYALHCGQKGYILKVEGNSII
jgi:hypothetical protein